MNITISPAKAHYLEQVSAGLADLSEDEREEVVQDLSAHLAELSDEEVVSVLGPPDDFVAEFRASAGLDRQTRIPGLIGAARRKLEELGTRLSSLSNWPRWRPAWVWGRGWLIISVYAVISEGVAFFHFPIPAVGGRTIYGLLLVAAATWLSVWIDRKPKGRGRDLASAVYSALGVWALLVGTLGGTALGAPAVFDQIDERLFSEYPVSSHDGSPVENIFAFDSDGEPVEVLLFDQLGRPLLTLPEWVYDQAQMSPSGEAEYYNGYVTFPRDEFGRLIPNLYPLELRSWNEWGELVPAEPPAAWSSPDDDGVSTPPTTIGRTGGE